MVLADRGFGSLCAALNASAPSKSALGSVNAIAQLLACASRSVGPMLAGSVQPTTFSLFFPLSSSLSTSLPLLPFLLPHRTENASLTHWRGFRHGSALYALSVRLSFPLVWLFYGSFAVVSIVLARRVKGKEELDRDEEDRRRDD